MPYRFIFMISLILLLGCENDKQNPVFSGNEANEYQKIKDDFDAPEFKWGYLNEEGQLAIEDKYDDLRAFNEGLAAFNKGGIWGYIDVNGKEAIPARYRTVKTYSEGIAVVQDLNGRFHLISSEGNILADSLKYDDVYKFQEGKSVVYQGYTYGFIDKFGKEVIKPTYYSARSFSNGLAMVQLDNSFGFIDHDNNPVIPIIYDKVWYPQEEMVRFKRDSKFGFIDLSTKKEIYAGFASATDFQNNHAIVNDGNNFLLIDKVGKKKTLPFSFVDTGGEGKWIYAADAKFGFLKNNGEVLCLPQYDLLMRYREGRAGFAIEDSWGYVDENGIIIVPAQYPLVWDYVNGYARMVGSYGFGFIDKNGLEVLPPQYMEVRDFSEGMARIQVYR